MVVKRGLGKGLNELLSATLGSGDAGACVMEERVSSAEAKGFRLAQLPVHLMISGPYQPRQSMGPDGLEQLAESIRRQGVLQPIVVRKNGDIYEIVAGERRWRAAQLAGLTEIPALQKEMSDEEAMAIALIENIQRENLNPIDEARAIHRLSQELSLTHLEVAEAIGKSRASVTNLLRILSLNPEVQGLLERGEIDIGHAKVLLALKGPLQNQMAATVVKRGLSVRETERIVQRLQAPTEQNKRTGSADPNIQSLERELTDRLGAAVNIRSSVKGAGSLIIHYHNNDELEGILAHIH